MFRPAQFVPETKCYMLKRDRAAQSLIEYVALFVIISLAMTATFKYVNRSMNARLKQVQEELEYKK